MLGPHVTLPIYMTSARLVWPGNIFALVQRRLSFLLVLKNCQFVSDLLRLPLESEIFLDALVSYSYTHTHTHTQYSVFTLYVA